MGKPGRPRGSSEIAPKIRKYFERAMDGLPKRHGKCLDEIIMDGLVDDFKGTITALAKYIPAEVEMTVDDKRADDMTDAELASIAATGSTGITETTKGTRKSKDVH